MCCSCKTSQIRVAGLILLSVLSAGLLIGYFFSDLGFKLSRPYSDYVSQLDSTSSIRLTLLVYAGIQAVIGYIAFGTLNLCLIVLFSFIFLITLVLCFGLAFIGIFLGTNNKMKDMLGCTPASLDLQMLWSQMDYIAGNVDNTLCNNDCPCSLTNTTGFEDTIDISATYSKYIIDNDSSDDVVGVPRFQNCSEPVKQKVQYKTANYTAFGNFSSTIYLWQVFEESFNCTGWCSMTYNNPSFNLTECTCMNPDKITPCNCTDYNGDPCSKCVDKKDNSSTCTSYIRPTKNIEKYLFSDINKGPAVNKGCLNSVLGWLMPTLLTYGSVGMVFCIGELGVFILAVSVCCADDDVKDFDDDEEPDENAMDDDPYRTSKLEDDIEKDMERDKEKEEEDRKRIEELEKQNLKIKERDQEIELKNYGNLNNTSYIHSPENSPKKVFAGESSLSLDKEIRDNKEIGDYLKENKDQKK